MRWSSDLRVRVLATRAERHRRRRRCRARFRRAAGWAAAKPALVGQWRFDELDGQVAVDDGPHRLDGRLGGTDAPEADDPVRIAGASGRALRFTGATFVRLPDSDALALQALTAEAVVRAQPVRGQWRYLISRGSQACAAGAYGLYTAAAGGLAFYVFDGTRYIVSATARPDDVWNGAWHHVAGSFDGRALRLFVDGRPVGEPSTRRCGSTTPQPRTPPRLANTRARASSASAATSTSCGCRPAPDPRRHWPWPPANRAQAPARPVHCPPPHRERCLRPAHDRRRGERGPASCVSCARPPLRSDAPSCACG